MTGKKRLLMALSHREGDRVPAGEIQICPEMASDVIGYKTLFGSGFDEMKALWEGRRDEVILNHTRTLVDLTRKLELDYVRVREAPPDIRYTMPKMTGPYSWIDSKTGREMSYNPKAGSMAHSEYNRDISIDDLPDPEDGSFTVDDSTMDVLRNVVSELGDTHFIIFRGPDGTFPWEDTGMEEFLMRMATDEEFVIKAINGAVNRNIKIYGAALDAGADAVMTCDDYSDNRGPIMGPESFRKFILPAIKKQADAIHKKGGFFIKHTDGNVWSILDDLIDAGIDGWHGIQMNIGMDLAKLKKLYGEKICFFGGVNCETYITGSAGEVRNEIKNSLRNAAAGGGLVLSCSNVVPPGSRLDIYRAGLECLREFGKYPIKF